MSLEFNTKFCCFFPYVISKSANLSIDKKHILIEVKSGNRRPFTEKTIEEKCLIPPITYALIPKSDCRLEISISIPIYLSIYLMICRLSTLCKTALSTKMEWLTPGSAEVNVLSRDLWKLSFSLGFYFGFITA